MEGVAFAVTVDSTKRPHMHNGKCVKGDVTLTWGLSTIVHPLNCFDVGEAVGEYPTQHHSVKRGKRSSDDMIIIP